MDNQFVIELNKMELATVMRAVMVSLRKAYEHIWKHGDIMPKIGADMLAESTEQTERVLAKLELQVPAEELLVDVSILGKEYWLTSFMLEEDNEEEPDGEQISELLDKIVQFNQSVFGSEAPKGD